MARVDSSESEPTEVNFDGIVGPSHNYAGLSPGNLASTANRGTESNPRAAARQGLTKIRALLALGVPQGVLPPQHRPDIGALRALGFGGLTDADTLGEALSSDRLLLHSVSSASSMWTANAATVTPSSDAADRRLHVTPANLTSNFHRALEVPQTARTLSCIFEDPGFRVHRPLIASPSFADEGAANHTRLRRSDGSGVHVFVYGRSGHEETGSTTLRFPARQTRLACEAIARRHQLRQADVCLLQQRPEAIDQGVFHNDVISVGHDGLFLAHESAFAEPDAVERLREIVGPELIVNIVKEAELPLSEAVRSYLFNSQIVTRADGKDVLIAPTNAQDSSAARGVIAGWIESGLLEDAVFFDLRESMRNGGGPACLRLRIPLTLAEQRSLRGRCLVNAEILDELEAWVDTHYRDRLRPEDLADPTLLDESRIALDTLTALLGLGSIYPFQVAGAFPTDS